MQILEETISINDSDEITLDIKNEYGVFIGLTISETLLTILAHDKPDNVMGFLRDLYDMTHND